MSDEYIATFAGIELRSSLNPQSSTSTRPYMTLIAHRPTNQFNSVSSISFEIDEDVDLPTLLEQAVTPLILALGYEPASLHRCYIDAAADLLESAQLLQEP